MINDQFFNLFNESLKIISYCPICNSHYDPLAAKILAQKNDAHLIYIKCLTCQTAILAVIMAGSIGVSSIGLITDLNSDDVKRFKEAKAVTPDDVIEIHQNLSQEKVLIDQLI